jgi:hypothetical protein
VALTTIATAVKTAGAPQVGRQGLASVLCVCVWVSAGVTRGFRGLLGVQIQPHGGPLRHLLTGVKHPAHESGLLAATSDCLL